MNQNNNFEINCYLGLIQGEIYKESDDFVTIKVNLIKEKDEWKHFTKKDNFLVFEKNVFYKIGKSL